LKLEFEEYSPRKIVNTHKHVDGPWFWGKYTAHPYIGCRSGCEFCYLRGNRYLDNNDPDTFDTHIRVKINAVELLKKELPKLQKDVISVGDWQQPAESRYMLSRKMLEVVNDYQFPVFIVERSPLLLRDIDLLSEINRKSWVGVQYSMSSVDPVLKHAFEPRSPGVKRRLMAIEELAKAGITAGIAFMPILPLFSDDRIHLEDAIKAVKDHGGAFVVAGGLTMDGVQAEITLEAARKFDPGLPNLWRELYGVNNIDKINYSPPGSYASKIGYLVRELCVKHSLLDRMPRYIEPGELAVNKRLSEKLFLMTYDLELKQANNYKIWAYRKAAWTVDELTESIKTIYQRDGQKGLTSLPGIGSQMAEKITNWLDRHSEDNNPL
jgi:DNA repair photolyase